jgi:agmatinase
MRLVVSDDLALESQDESHVVVVNMASAARVKLSVAAYRFLKAFSSPRRVDQVVPDHDAARLLPQVRMLVDRQMLVDADAPPAADTGRLRAAVAYKFCGAPAHAKAAPADFIVIGAPYDLAGDTESRLAPALIRQKSLDYSYQLEFGDGRPRGWFDVNRGVRMLRGARIADAGDVPVEYGESRARYFERVGAALAECCTGRTVPVILGGDRSVTHAAVRALSGERKLTIVQITPEPARAAAEGAGRNLLRIGSVERVVSLGAWHEDEDAHAPGGGDLPVRTVETLRERGPDEIVRALGENLSIYLSIDLAVVTDSCMKAATAGHPPGLTVHELKLAIAAIGRVHRIAGIDLVGLDLRSRSPELAAVIGCHLALAAMSAAYDRL